MRLHVTRVDGDFFGGWGWERGLAWVFRFAFSIWIHHCGRCTATVLDDCVLCTTNAIYFTNSKRLKVVVGKSVGVVANTNVNIIYF